MPDNLTLPSIPNPQVGIERLNDSWWVGCEEPFCGAEENYPTFTYKQAQKWRTAHRKAHMAGTVPVGRIFRAAWSIHIECNALPPIPVNEQYTSDNASYWRTKGIEFINE